MVKSTMQEPYNDLLQLIIEDIFRHARLKYVTKKPYFFLIVLYNLIKYITYSVLMY